MEQISSNWRQNIIVKSAHSGVCPYVSCGVTLFSSMELALWLCRSHGVVSVKYISGCKVLGGVPCAYHLVGCCSMSSVVCDSVILKRAHLFLNVCEVTFE